MVRATFLPRRSLGEGNNDINTGSEGSAQRRILQHAPVQEWFSNVQLAQYCSLPILALPNARTFATAQATQPQKSAMMTKT